MGKQSFYPAIIKFLMFIVFHDALTVRLLQFSHPALLKLNIACMLFKIL